MSRTEFSGKDWMIAVGNAGSVCGHFVQVWRQPESKENEPLIIVDNLGVRFPKESKEIPLAAGMVLIELTKKYKEFDQSSSESFVTDEYLKDIAVAFGFPSEGIEVMVERMKNSDKPFAMVTMDE